MLVVLVVFLRFSHTSYESFLEYKSDRGNGKRVCKRQMGGHTRGASEQTYASALCPLVDLFWFNTNVESCATTTTLIFDLWQLTSSSYSWSSLFRTRDVGHSTEVAAVHIPYTLKTRVHSPQCDFRFCVHGHKREKA